MQNFGPRLAGWIRDHPLAYICVFLAIGLALFTAYKRATGIPDNASPSWTEAFGYALAGTSVLLVMPLGTIWGERRLAFWKGALIAAAIVVVLVVGGDALRGRSFGNRSLVRVGLLTPLGIGMFAVTERRARALREFRIE